MKLGGKMDPIKEGAMRLLEHVGGGQLIRNLSPMRYQQIIEIMGKSLQMINHE